MSGKRKEWQKEVRSIYRDFCVPNRVITKVFDTVCRDANPETDEEVLRDRCVRKLISLL